TYAEQLLVLAQQKQNSGHLVLAHQAAGATLYMLGELAPAQRHLEQGLVLYCFSSIRACTAIVSIIIDYIQNGNYQILYTLPPAKGREGQERKRDPWASVGYGVGGRNNLSIVNIRFNNKTRDRK